MGMKLRTREKSPVIEVLRTYGRMAEIGRK